MTRLFYSAPLVNYVDVLTSMRQDTSIKTANDEIQVSRVQVCNQYCAKITLNTKAFKIPLMHRYLIAVCSSVINEYNTLPFTTPDSALCSYV